MEWGCSGREAANSRKNGKLRVQPNSGYKIGQIIPGKDQNGNIHQVPITGFLTEKETGAIVEKLKEFKHFKIKYLETQQASTIY